MSLLDSMPHECTIRYRRRSKGTLGGSKDSYTNVSTGTECWEQSASATEINEFKKRGMSLISNVFFNANPNVSSKHQILITKRNGATVSSPVALDVLSSDAPDASAGIGVVWKVSAGRKTSETD